MQIRVLFFGVLKDVAGCSERVFEAAPGASIGDVFESCAGSFPQLREMRSSILLARNQEFAQPADRVSEGDEIALLPPVSGGTGCYTRELTTPEGHFFVLTRTTIDTRELVHTVLRGEDGAVVTFEGVVRNNTEGRRTEFLEYDCYEPMALKVMAEMGCELARGHEIGRLAIVHRLGRMEIGETSVAIVVGAPHRKAAFEAAAEAIGRLKKRVPIWKKEYFADGEAWVEGEWDQSLQRR